jgi:NitT/TauT family transport system substrate-binding protein
LTHASTIGVAGVLGVSHRDAAAEPPPEVSKIRIVRSPSICLAPSYLAEELLRLEGFSEIEYIAEVSASGSKLLADGQADASMVPVQETIPDIDAGRPVVLLGGVHSGCYELFGNGRVSAIRDLKGKTVAISSMGAADHVFIASILAYVGMNPGKDINWVTTGSIPETMRFFVEGKADAFLAFPPQPQEMRAKKIGRLIVDTAVDRPWSQYFCCMVAANRTFVQRYPVATKRAIRAILKAADICAQDPERAAKYLVDKGYEAVRCGAGGTEGASVRSLASDRSGRHSPISCTQARRGRTGQIGPEQADRPRHRLAILERTEAGVEGLRRGVRRGMRGQTMKALSELAPFVTFPRKRGKGTLRDLA